MKKTPKSRREKISREKVVAVYPYIETNPYQKLLCGALEKRGYRICKLPRIDSTFPFELVSQCSNAEVVHFHWIEHLYGARIRLFSPVRAAVLLAILIVLRMRGKRIVYTLHNLVPHNTRRVWFHLFVQRLIIQLADATIVHSRQALEIARKTFGSGSKFEIVPHGRYDGYYPNLVPRVEARAFLKIPNEAKVALFLGSMGGYKGARLLLRSAEELDRRGIRILLAGEATELEASDRELLKEALTKNATFHDGFVPESQLQYFLNSADCLVLPYLESFTSGMAFLGLSFRLPIVGTSAPAFSEMIDRRLCLSCDPNNPSSMADAIEEVCFWDRTEFEDRCANFLAAFGWDEIAGQHLVIYGFSEKQDEDATQGIRRSHASQLKEV